MWGAASSKTFNTQSQCPRPPEASSERFLANSINVKVRKVPAAGPLSMPFTPELKNSKALPTCMSASTEANSISCKFLLIGSLFSRLHPNAVFSGDLIQIPGIPRENCRSIQRLVLRGELNWAKHMKVSIDLGHPPKQKYFGISGAISFKMPLEIHEQLSAFASIVQREMWNQGTSDSFYPPDLRHREHFITTTESTSINLQPMTTANIITFSKFSQ